MLCRKGLVLGMMDGVVLNHEYYIKITTSGVSGRHGFHLH